MFDDPLFALVYQINSTKKYTTDNYPENAYPVERDAYLWQVVPENILARLYPELYDYTNELFSKARQQIQTTGDLQPRSISDIRLLSRRHEQKVQYHNHHNPYFEHAEQLFEHNQFPQADEAFAALINSGHNTKIGNLYRGMIAHYQGNPKNAALFLKRAFKKGYDDTYARWVYAKSLHAIEHYKDAEKNYKLLLKDCQKALTNNLYQDIEQARIQEMYDDARDYLQKDTVTHTTRAKI